MRSLEYHRPTSLDAALKLKAAVEGARVIAGGTDLMVRIRGREVAPPALISLRSVPEVAGVGSDGGLRIGAATTFTDLIDDPAVARDYPVLAEAAGRVGSSQIRNVGTIGGNIANASPCADSALPLLVHEARARLASSRRHREVPLRDLFVGPGATAMNADEILTHLILPPPDPGTAAVFFKHGRVEMDLSIASVAVLLVLDGEVCRKARIAAGSVAPTPLRLTAAEAVLEGEVVDGDRAQRAAAAAMRCVAPISDVRAGADYRRHLIGVFVRRAIAGLLGREGA